MGTARAGRTLRVLGACLAVGLLASCGAGGDREVTWIAGALPEPTPRDEARGTKLARAATEHFTSAKSMRIEVAAGGRVGMTGSLRMDRDHNCTADFDGGPLQRGELRVIGGEEAYMRFSDASLTAIREAAEARGPEVAARVRERTALVRGKYLKLPMAEGSSGSGGGAALSTDMCDLDQFTDAVGPPEGRIKALPATRKDGERVVPLVEEGGDDDTTVYVTTGARPRIVAVEGTDRGRPLEMHLSRYDEPVVVHAPPPALVLDLSDLGGGAGGGSLFMV